MQATAASWRAKLDERLHERGIAGYVAIWMARPSLELSIAALIYGSAHPQLLRYAVVGLAANAFIFNTLFYIGEILDEERLKGTLVALFLAPCRRSSWLTGFALVGLVETALIAAVTLFFGHFAFGVRFDPNLPAVVLSLLLFLIALWGLGFLFSAIGLLIKRANPLSNLLYSFTMLLGGVYYPVALLPDWLRYPARALPLGYGTQALASSILYHASIREVAPQLLPLAGFALTLPVAGALTFAWLERHVRRRGELDFY